MALREHETQGETSMKLRTLPMELSWKNNPLSSESRSEDSLIIVAGSETDWFSDPAGGPIRNNAPVAMFSAPDEDFVLSAKVSVGFNSTFDAGVLFLYENSTHWAKLCLEYSPLNEAMIVSVVTRGRSDDCNSMSIEGHSTYLRIYRQSNRLAFHQSEDGEYWHLVRHFTMGNLKNLRAGFSAQAPTGELCQAEFEEIRYQKRRLTNIRNGE